MQYFLFDSNCELIIFQTNLKIAYFKFSNWLKYIVAVAIWFDKKTYRQIRMHNTYVRTGIGMF